MTVDCPSCRASVPIDSAGNSACGHLRGGPGAPAPPPVAQTAAPPPAPAAAPPPAPAAAPPPAPQATPVAPPPAPQAAPLPQSAGPRPPEVPGLSAPLIPLRAPSGAPPGWPPAPHTGGGIGKVVGVIAVGGVLVLAALMGIGMLAGGDPGSGSPAPSDRANSDASSNPASTSGIAGETPPPATTPLAGTVTVGASGPVAKAKVKAGRTLTISTPDDGPVPGLTITVPADAYPGKTGFTVSAAPITVDGFAGAVTPLTPLITVENGGTEAEQPVLVTIPVTIPDGAFAMGFYLRDDGSLEGIPVADATSTSITLATRHFSSFFVSAIAEAALPTDVGTGFRVGEDDFQTPNYGSVIAPRGHCVGQSLASIWYFVERKGAGEPPLFGRFDGTGAATGATTPGFWQDDRTVYRLASTIQRDIDMKSAQVALGLDIQTAKLQRLVWLSARYAMHVTGEPQLIDLRETGTKGGHAVVAYAATASGLWVADPNFPGRLRQVGWNAGAGRFDPYESGATAADSARHYDAIGYWGTTAMVGWSRIGARWAEADAGMEGDDRFPGGLLSVGVPGATGTLEWLPWTSGITLPTSDVMVAWDLDDVAIGDRVTLYVGQDAVGTFDPSTYPVVTLPSGESDLGFFIEAPNGTGGWVPVDFLRRRTVTPAPGAPTPTAPVATTAPVPEPTPSATYDCSTLPEGQIEQLDWSLHCAGDAPIAPAP